MRHICSRRDSFYSTVIRGPSLISAPRNCYEMQWIKMIHDHHYLEKDMSSPSTLAYFRELLCEEHVQPDNADFTLEELVLHCFHGKILVALFAELREYFELDPWKIRDSKEWDQPFNELTQRELESCIGEVA
ncbi:hypothetical protein VTN49DRAFT_8045 [Thermomyces lanuginosus]|uniref:uncharacterized protein n=1 Tax=Thermomyces lanuginosus TaxID=5541 RepID=UPI0037443666